MVLNSKNPRLGANTHRNDAAARAIKTKKKAMYESVHGFVSAFFGLIEIRVDGIEFAVAGRVSQDGIHFAVTGRIKKHGVNLAVAGRVHHKGVYVAVAGAIGHINGILAGNLGILLEDILIGIILRKSLLLKTLPIDQANDGIGTGTYGCNTADISDEFLHNSTPLSAFVTHIVHRV